MATLFGQDVRPRTIERVSIDKGAPLWAWVVVARRRVAQAPASKIEELGLVAGAPWDEATRDRVNTAARVLKAKLKAVVLLKARALTSSQLAAALNRKGFGQEVAATAIAELAREGLIDDGVFAVTKAKDAIGKGLAREAAQRRLVRAGVPAAIASYEVDLAAGPIDDRSRALAQARNRAAKIPESLKPATRYRRVLDALARLGYEEEVAREAAAAAVGIRSEAA